MGMTHYGAFMNITYSYSHTITFFRSLSRSSLHIPETKRWLKCSNCSQINSNVVTANVVMINNRCHYYLVHTEQFPDLVQLTKSRKTGPKRTIFTLFFKCNFNNMQSILMQRKLTRHKATKNCLKLLYYEFTILRP